MTEEQFMEDLVTVLEEIKKRPELFLDERSLSRLRVFLVGFCRAYHNCDKEKKFFYGFEVLEEQIRKKYSEYSKAISFYSIILEHTKDEEEALNVFFQEFDILLKKYEREIN